MQRVGRRMQWVGDREQRGAVGWGVEKSGWGVGRGVQRGGVWGAGWSAEYSGVGRWVLRVEPRMQ